MPDTFHPEARGRVLQSAQEENDLVTGDTVLELVGAIAPETQEAPSTKFPDVVFLRTNGPHWHRFFLDAGLAFWGVWPKEDAFADWDDGHVFDLAEELGVRGRRLGSLLVFPGASDAAEIHLHLSEGDKLVLRQESPNDWDGRTQVDLRKGTVEATYLEFLQLCDDAKHVKAPDGFDRNDAASDGRRLRDALSNTLGRNLGIEQHLSGASFHSEIILQEDTSGRSVRHSSLRLSNFGAMAGIAGPALGTADLEVVRDALRHHNFIYVPSQVLSKPYDGPASDQSTWWSRYFGHR